MSVLNARNVLLLVRLMNTRLIGFVLVLVSGGITGYACYENEIVRLFVTLLVSILIGIVLGVGFVIGLIFLVKGD